MGVEKIKTPNLWTFKIVQIKQVKEHFGGWPLQKRKQVIISYLLCSLTVNLPNVRNAKSAVRRLCFSEIFSHTIRTSLEGGRGEGGVFKGDEVGHGGWGPNILVFCETL